MKDIITQNWSTIEQFL